LYGNEPAYGDELKTHASASLPANDMNLQIEGN
jgi:hypothetical protein